MCHDYDFVLKTNAGAEYIIPTALEPSHAYVSVSASNEINRLVIVLIRAPYVAGKDKGPGRDESQLNVSF